MRGIWLENAVLFQEYTDDDTNDGMTHDEGGVSEEGESSTLQGDQLGTVGGQADDALVSELGAGGDAEVTDIRAALQQGHQSLVLNVPTSLEIENLKARAISCKIVQSFISNVKAALENVINFNIKINKS